MKYILTVGLSVVLTVLCLWGTVECHSSEFDDCGSIGVKVTNVDITPCSTDPCPVISGKVSTIAVSFQTTSPASNITAKAYGSIGPLKVPYKLPQPDACQKSNITCPLKPQANYVYSFSLPIPKNLPEVNVVVELDLIVDSKKYLCIEFPVVVEPSGKVFKKEQVALNDV